MKTSESDIIICDDGTTTLRHPIIGEAYHSTRGSFEESKHIFINAGYKAIDKADLTIFEVGFGTALNAILTLRESLKDNKTVLYNTIELYPLDLESIDNLHFSEKLTTKEYNLFRAIHSAPWNEITKITENFSINKICGDLTTEKLPENIDIVYFDAFAPDTQPELWSEEIFTKIYNNMNSQGVLVTYSAKGIVKKALRSVGFEVKRLKGALGKHHMVRASKQ